MKIRIFAVLLVLPLLISCGEKVTNPVLSPSAFVKATVTPALFSTPIPSMTLSLTATTQQTPIPYPTTPAEATQQAIANQYCDSQSFPFPQGFLLSNSGKLMAFVCWTADGKDISVTKVVALDGSYLSAQASYRKDYLGIDYTTPLPNDIQESNPIWINNKALFPIRWSADDKFLYMAKISPASGVPYPPQIFALMRLDVGTGKVSPVLPPIGSYYYDFSTDGTKLLSVDEVQNPLIVKVLDIGTGEEIKIYLDKRFDEAGSFRLSPDSHKMLISALDEEKGYSIILANLQSGSQIYLDDRYDFVLMSWVDEYTIYGSGRENGNVFFFYLDTTTMQTSPAPAPTPISSSTP